MDKFDQSIKNAQKIYQPSDNFIDRTMQRVNGSPKKTKGFKMWLPILAGSLAAIAIVFIGLNSTSHNTGNSNLPGPSPTLATGINDASLAGDLSSISASLAQDSSNLNSTNNALGDQQQQVAIPINP